MKQAYIAQEDVCMYGWRDKRTDGWMDEWMDGWTKGLFYQVLFITNDNTALVLKIEKLKSLLKFLCMLTSVGENSHLAAVK